MVRCVPHQVSGSTRLDLSCGATFLPEDLTSALLVLSLLRRTEGGLVARIGDLAARGGGYRRMGPFLTSDRHRAIQNEPRSPPSHPEAAAQGDELGRL